MGEKLRRWIAPLIILIGIAVLVYPSLSEYLSQKNSSRAVSVYDDSVSRMETEEKQKMLEAAREYNRQLVESAGYEKPRIDEHGNPVSLDSYEDILDVNGLGMMGYIAIPLLNETIPIYHGTDESVLQTGVGHLKNTSFPVGGASTHAVLSGHRGLPTASLFTDLDAMQEGDRFYIKVLDETLCYTVDRIVTVLPEETQELAIQPDGDYVTLVTCTPYGVNSHRLLVRGVRTPYTEETESEYAKSEEKRITFWEQLPIQYRHMLLGACAIIIFLLVRFIVMLILKKTRKKGESEHEEN
jgi:sortase A